MYDDTNMGFSVTAHFHALQHDIEMSNKGLFNGFI